MDRTRQQTGITPNMNAVRLGNIEARIVTGARRLEFQPAELSMVGGWSGSSEPPVPRFDPNNTNRATNGNCSGLRSAPRLNNYPYPRPTTGSTSKYAYPATTSDQTPVLRVKLSDPERPEAFKARSPMKPRPSPPPPPQLTSSLLCVPSYPPVLPQTQTDSATEKEKSDDPNKDLEFSTQPEPTSCFGKNGEVEVAQIQNRRPNCWIFSKEHMLHRTPSRKLKETVSAEKELLFRQEAACFINAMGCCLNLRHLPIHTATVYMHRFYMIHPFTTIHWKPLAAAAVYLASKIEEQPQTIHNIVKIACQVMLSDGYRGVEDDRYKRIMTEVLGLENILIQTLGFQFGIDHPHKYILSFPELCGDYSGLLNQSFMKACYAMATKSLRYTTLNLELSSKIIACMCIHACATQMQLQIPKKDGRDWFALIEPSLTLEQLDKYTNYFLAACRKVPENLKEQFLAHDIRNIVGNGTPQRQPWVGVTSPFSPVSAESGKSVCSGSG